MKVSLPTALENFVSNQVEAGEFHDASAVVSEAVRLLREAKEITAMEEMREVFAAVDSVGGKGQPRSTDRALIQQVIKQHRLGKRRR